MSKPSSIKQIDVTVTREDGSTQTVTMTYPEVAQLGYRTAPLTGNTILEIYCTSIFRVTEAAAGPPGE